MNDNNQSSNKCSDSKKAEITMNLNTVRKEVEHAFKSSSAKLGSFGKKPKLVAVSKMHSVEDIMIAYENGQRDFGENYASELFEKSEQCPKDINWHFIGAIQSKNLKILTKIPNLVMIQTIDNIHHAKQLNNLCSQHRINHCPLDVLIQVNTSGESQKHGVMPNETQNLYSFIKNECPYLHFNGLMTIGQDLRSEITLSNMEKAPGKNKDFQVLLETRDLLVKQMSQEESRSFELSFGMSSDFKVAISMGASIVRIGSNIFGQRPSVSLSN